LQTSERQAELGTAVATSGAPVDSHIIFRSQILVAGRKK
jgi:hypothetical protein